MNRRIPDHEETKIILLNYSLWMGTFMNGHLPGGKKVYVIERGMSLLMNRRYMVHVPVRERHSCSVGISDSG